jgi:two-component system, OmpR family, sensor kinase
LSLRSRLLLTIAGLLALALVGSGASVVALTRSSLIEQLDGQLLGATRDDVIDGGPRGPGGRDPTGRRLALIQLDPMGAVVASAPSGFARNPDPLPDLGAPGSDELPLNRIVERPAVDGSLAYRVRVWGQARGGDYLVLAAPMREVDGVTGQLVINLLLVSAAVLGALLLIGWLLIRRDLRPLEQVTQTAERISAGDLAQRVGEADPRTEVGRLAGAFDTMLDQIEASFAEQRRALVAKERSEGRLRQFVADASHELRTPLTTVRGYSELYAAGGLTEDEAIALAMRRIGTESRRMGQLVDDLLLLARLDQGRPLRRESVSLTNLIRDAIDDARAIEPGRPISASVADDVSVIGDEDRLRQVIGNLLANVRVHTPADLPLEVSLTADVPARRATLIVADHGSGIPPEHADSIFDRFYRVDVGRSRDRGGSGLGLAIVSAIVGAHGGMVSHSPTPGGGATFTISLPLA